jgi:hypothetical protein
MFSILNQRWLVLLQERELMSHMNIQKRPPHQNWLKSFLHWCRQKLSL